MAIYNKKEILQYINKYGEDIVPPDNDVAVAVDVDEDDTTPPDITVKAPPRYGPYVPPKPKNLAIENMQKAIINFSKSITFATKDFNDFMVDSYSNDSGIRAEEWDPNPEADQSPVAKKPAQLIKLRNIVRDLQVSVLPTALKDASGVWGEKTQNAVKNVWAFADALIRVYNDFEMPMPNPEFTTSDLQSLGEHIPKTPASYPGRITKYTQAKLEIDAEAIEPLVIGLEMFYKKFVRKILYNPSFTKYVKQQKDGTTSAFGITSTSTSTTPAPTPALSAIQNKILSNIGLTKADGSEINVNIPLTVLQNSASLQKFLSDTLRYSDTEIMRPDILLKILNEIKSEVNDRLSFAKS